MAKEAVRVRGLSGETQALDLSVVLFESAWKLLWLGVVALLLRLGGEPDLATRVMTRDLLLVVSR